MRSLLSDAALWLLVGIAAALFVALRFVRWLVAPPGTLQGSAWLEGQIEQHRMERAERSRPRWEP